MKVLLSLAAVLLLASMASAQYPAPFSPGAGGCYVTPEGRLVCPQQFAQSRGCYIDQFGRQVCPQSRPFEQPAVSVYREPFFRPGPPAYPFQGGAGCGCGAPGCRMLVPPVNSYQFFGR